MNPLLSTPPFARAAAFVAAAVVVAVVAVARKERQ